VGDLSICAYCGTILSFIALDPLAFRLATEEEQAFFRGCPQGQTALMLYELFAALKGGSSPHYDVGHV